MEENSNTEEIKSTNETVNDASAGDKAGEFSKKKSSFLPGFLLGMLTMLLAFAVLVIILCLKKVIYLSAGGGLVDAEVTSKAETIKAYLDQYSLYETNEEDLKKGMLSGLLKGTGDKYAYYYDAEEMQALVRDYDGTFYGIGAFIQSDPDGNSFISGTYENSPAEKAGLLTGDIITHVDGKSTKGYDRYEVAQMIRGDLGTTVVLTVLRDGEELEISVKRDKLKKIDVSYEMSTDKIGYIYIKDFDDVTIDQFAEALATLKGQGMEDMILDLRGNTGGLLRVTIEVAKQIMCKGKIVTIENAGGKVKDYECDGSREFKGRIVILTDGYTASASEILTGALRDNGMAVTLGTRTYGKGLVQNFYYMSDGSGIKFTTNEYYTPSGAAINEVGIEPDIEVELDYEAYLEDGSDNQLQAAIDYLEK